MGDLGALYPRQIEFQAVKPEIMMVEEEERAKTSRYKLMGLRRSNEKAKTKKTLSKVIDVQNHY